MAKDVSLDLLQQMQFRLRTGSGHDLTIDATPDVGGAGGGPGPTELLLSALAGCAAMDVISILRKMRQEVTSYRVEAHGEQAKTHPRKFTSIVITHRLSGAAVHEANVRRAIALSMARYCPVYAVLAPTVQIQERYEIADPAGGPPVTGIADPAEAAPDAA